MVEHGLVRELRARCVFMAPEEINLDARRRRLWSPGRGRVYTRTRSLPLGSLSISPRGRR